MGGTKDSGGGKEGVGFAKPTWFKAPEFPRFHHLAEAWRPYIVPSRHRVGCLLEKDAVLLRVLGCVARVEARVIDDDVAGERHSVESLRLEVGGLVFLSLSYPVDEYGWLIPMADLF